MAKKSPKTGTKALKTTLLVSPDDYLFVSPAADTAFTSGTAVNVIVKAPTNANSATVYSLKVLGLYDPQDGMMPSLYDLGFFTSPTAGEDVNGFTEYTFSVTLNFTSRVVPPTTSAVINFCEAVTADGNTTWQVRRTLNITLAFPTFLVIA